MTTFFTSDHHFGHANIIEYCRRPFASAEEMDAEMEARWRARVRPDDLVYHLGDFSFGPLDAIARRARALPGRKVLIVGNHDTHHFRRKASQRCLDFFMREAGFEQAVESMPLEINGRAVFLSHRPEEEATMQALRAELNLHGHVHERYNRRGSRINVGVDVRGFEPRTLEELTRAG